METPKWQVGDIVNIERYGKLTRATLTKVPPSYAYTATYSPSGSAGFVAVTESGSLLYPSVTKISPIAPDVPMPPDPVVPDAPEPVDTPADPAPPVMPDVASPAAQPAPPDAPVKEAVVSDPVPVPVDPAGADEAGRIVPASGMPARLIAGDSWAWVSRVPVVSGVDLAAVLRPRSGGAPVTIPAGNENGRRVLRVTSAKSANIAPGSYVWVEVLTRPAGGARWTADDGRVEILPDPTASGNDMRGHAERILEAIDARLAGRVTEDCDAYTIEGRSITRTPLDVLMRVRGIYARQVAAQYGRGGVQFQGVSFR